MDQYPITARFPLICLDDVHGKLRIGTEKLDLSFPMNRPIRPTGFPVHEANLSETEERRILLQGTTGTISTEVILFTQIVCGG